MDNVLYNATDVTIAFGIVELPESGRRLVMVRVRLELQSHKVDVSNITGRVQVNRTMACDRL